MGHKQASMQRTSLEQTRAWQRIVRVLSTLSLALCFVASPAMHAEDFQVVGTAVFGGSNLLIRTNGTKVQYSSVLSDDKQRLTLTIKNAGIKTEQREVNSARGMIESAIMQRIGRDVVINVYFRQSAGYTAVLLPYSRSLSIDVFQWTKLSSSEDQYRSGLIALQNNVMSVAKDLIFAAAQAKHPDATAFAGFVSAREGNFVDAKDFFLKALERKSAIGDIYGGLAQVSRIESNELKAREYENQFVQRMGRPPYFDEEQLKIQKVVPPVAEPASLASLTKESTADSVNTADTTLTQPSASGDSSTNSLMAQLRSLQAGSATGSDVTTQSAPTAAKPLFAWLDSALLGFGAALVLIGLVFLRGYTRWKKQQLAYVKLGIEEQRKSAAFGSNLQQAMAVSEQQAVNIYKRSASLLDRQDEEESQMPQVQEQARNSRSNNSSALASRYSDGELQAERPKEVKVPSVPASTSADDDLFDFDESFYASRKPASKATTSPSSFESDLGTKSPLYNTDADPQLSAGQVPQASSSATQPIATNPVLDVDAESLEALASQLGIDPNLLSTVRKRKSSQSPTS